MAFLTLQALELQAIFMMLGATAPQKHMYQIASPHIIPFDTEATITTEKLSSTTSIRGIIIPNGVGLSHPITYQASTLPQQTV